MTRIRFKGSPRSLACSQATACGLSAPRRSSPRNGVNVGRWRGLSTRPARICTGAIGNLLCVGVDRVVSRAADRGGRQQRKRMAMLQPLPLGRLIVAGGIIVDGAVVVA